MVDSHGICHRRVPISTVEEMAFPLRTGVPRDMDTVCATTASRKSEKLILFENGIELRTLRSGMDPFRIPRCHAHDKMMKK